MKGWLLLNAANGASPGLKFARRLPNDESSDNDNAVNMQFSVQFGDIAERDF